MLADGVSQAGMLVLLLHDDYSLDIQAHEVVELLDLMAKDGMRQLDAKKDVGQDGPSNILSQERKNCRRRVERGKDPCLIGSNLFWFGSAIG